MKKLLALLPLLAFIFSCAHPAVEAKEREVGTFTKIYKDGPNEVYKALTLALKTEGYGITTENLTDGVVVSGWKETTIDSHYVDPFYHRNYGANGGYYKLEFHITPEADNSSQVKIVSYVKSLVPHLKTSGIVEKKMFHKLSNYLRKDNIKVTNIGIEE